VNPANRRAMTASEDPLAGIGYGGVTASLPYGRIGDGAAAAMAIVAQEVPIALVYNGRSHAVVMGTPDDLEDLAFGFSLTEGIVRDAADIQRLSVVKASHGIELQMQIPMADADALEDRSRGLVARTGCGLCGVETIREALRAPVRVGRSLSVPEEALWRAGGELGARQHLNSETNTVHAAGWSDAGGTLGVVREDVGRHNALDKLFGALVRAGDEASRGFVVVTSRASYEMVQKSTTRGVELLAAISRPTSLAIRFAEAAGLTLVGLLRGRSANVYSHSERITTAARETTETRT
jgi:FdhD protein